MNQDINLNKKHGELAGKDEMLPAEVDAENIAPHSADGVVGQMPLNDPRDKVANYAELGKHAMDIVGRLAMDAMNDKTIGSQEYYEINERIRDACISEFEKSDIPFEQKQYWLEKLEKQVVDMGQFAAEETDKHLEHQQAIFDAVMFGATGGIYGLYKLLDNVIKGDKGKK